MSDPSNKLDRYRRQMRFAPLGEEGQHELAAARVLICGSGALGCSVADMLVRAGVGSVRLVDRDFVDLDNLHRQILFDESDAEQHMPKAVAASKRLAEINSQVQVEPIVADVNAANIRDLVQDVAVIVDGTDNFETRYLLNDIAVEAKIPWVFAGCVGAEGQTFAIVPGQTPCLTCIMSEPPPAEEMPTCESAGVLSPIVNLMASLQATETLKLLSGNAERLNPMMTFVDLWDNRIQTISMAGSRNSECSTCGKREFVWLSGNRGSSATQLCGRNSVQISPTAGGAVDLELLARKLDSVGTISANPYLLRAQVEEYLLTVFADGRTIVGGTDDPAKARTVHAKYVGN